MNSSLICPDPRPGVRHLSGVAPLAAVPLLGESLLEYWLTHLAGAGVRTVNIFASDRPELIAKLVGNGARWGMQATVFPEARELTPAEVISGRRPPGASREDCPEPVVLSCFPGIPDLDLFAGYEGMLNGLARWMPKANTVDRVGIHQVRPGVWLGNHARVAPEAQLLSPCWIGNSTYVGPRAVIGPMTILEDRVFVEPEAAVGGSYVGPDTFVGRLAVVSNSIAWGSTLVHWKSGAAIEVEDAFLLCSLRRTQLVPTRENRFGNVLESANRCPR